MRTGSRVEWTEPALAANHVVAYELTVRPVGDRDGVLRARTSARGVDPSPANNRVDINVLVG